MKKMMTGESPEIFDHPFKKKKKKSRIKLQEPTVKAGCFSWLSVRKQHCFISQWMIRVFRRFL